MQQVQRKIEQDAGNEKTTRIVLFVFVCIVLIIILVCVKFIKKDKKERYRNSERISRNRERSYSVDDNLSPHIGVDPVTFQGVSGHENQGRLLERNSSVSVHQMIRPSAPVLPIDNPTPTATSNVFGNNGSSSTGNREQISEDLPPTYDDCMKKHNINHQV